MAVQSPRIGSGTLVCLFTLAALFSLSALAAPRNLIICIGDGMGPEHVRAAGMYANGQAGKLSFEAFPYQGLVTTASADSAVTDSAAAATAIATGGKVNNGVLSLAIPGDGSELTTLLETYSDAGKSTGLVTTTYITHATPGAFGAHEPSRGNTAEIALDYLNQTRPNVLFGGGANGITPALAQNAGYVVLIDRAELVALDTESATYVSGQFGTSHLPYEFDGLGSLPHLSEMVSVALNILDNDPDGFFLLVEGGRIDHAAHSKDIQRNVPETVEFGDTVQVIVDWVQGRDDTLLIVTADHETGGLSVTQNNGQGSLPSVTWSTTGHTGVDVPVYAMGLGAELITGTLDNTDFVGVVEAQQGQSVPAAGAIAIGSTILLAAATGLMTGSAIRR